MMEIGLVLLLFCKLITFKKCFYFFLLMVSENFKLKNKKIPTSAK